MFCISKFVLGLIFGLGIFGILICALYAEESPEDTSKSIVYIANSFQETQDFHELVSMIEEMRDMLISHGCPVIPLTTILMNVRDILISEGVRIDDAFFERLYAQFAEYEAKQRIVPPDRRIL